VQQGDLALAKGQLQVQMYSSKTILTAVGSRHPNTGDERDDT
jgi:hypothetical protein